MFKFKQKKNKQTIVQTVQADLMDSEQALYQMYDKLLETILTNTKRDSEQVGEHLRKLFFDLMRSADITKCVEIGAYEATFSRVCRNEYPNLDVIAYEANPYVFERFGENLKKGGVDYRFACVSAENGKQTFTCLLYTSPSPRDGLLSRMPSSA